MRQGRPRANSRNQIEGSQVMPEFIARSRRAQRTARPTEAAAPRPVPDSNADLLTPALTASTVLDLQHASGNYSVQGLIRRALASVIQRNAATWRDWAALNGENGHTFAEAGGFIVVDDALDATEEFLTALSASNADELKKIFRAAKALQAANHEITAVPDGAPDKLQTFIKTKQTPAGGRMRFRAAIGPSGGASKLEKFITNRLAPAFGGATQLPDFLKFDNMSIGDRARLYDLPNSREDYPPEPLRWAQGRGTTSVGQFVNYVEYFAASQGELNKEVTQEANKRFEAQKGGVPQPA